MKILSTHGHETVERPDRIEQREADTRGIWWFLAGLFLLLVLSAFGMYALYRWLGTGPDDLFTADVSPLAPKLQVPPAPRLQTNPGLDMNTLRRREDRVLSTYGWVDESAGRVHIPIDRAIEILAQRGLPARAPGQVVTGGAPATGPESGGRMTGQPESGFGADPRTGGGAPALAVGGSGQAGAGGGTGAGSGARERSAGRPERKQ